MSKNETSIEMDLATGAAKPCGASRSVVRWIGSNLPLSPCPRVHFQLQTFSVGAAGGVAGHSEASGGLSLADVGLIDKERNHVSEGHRWEVSGLAFRAQQCSSLKRQNSLPSLHQVLPVKQSQTTVNEQAIQKINVLESELAKLRAQIAQIVQAQELNAQSVASYSGGCPPSSAPPPPPPPRPPPIGPGLQRSISAIDLIKERRKLKVEQHTVLESCSKQPEVPNMLDVLKDIGKVKLRSIKDRVEEQPKSKAEPVDPAALIAEALKRKFAHRYRNNSESESNFTLPPRETKPHSEVPVFGQHMLKSTGTKKLL